MTMDCTSSDFLLAQHRLDTIVSKRPWHNGIPIEQIVREPLEEPLLDFTVPILLCGPPNIGKTCYAIRQVWQWTKRHSDSAAFLLNPSWGDTPDLLMRLAERLPLGATLLYIIDNIDFASGHFAAWVDSVRGVLEREKIGPVHVIWIANDPSIADELATEGVCRPIVFRRGIESVVELYTKRLQRCNYELWQRVISAFETGLDPGISVEFRKLDPSESTKKQPDFSGFVDWLREQTHMHLRDEFADKYELLNDEGYNAYLILLPFGSISYPVEENFLQEMGVSTTAAVRALVRHGLARIIYRKNQVDQVVLTEHSLQIRKKLNALEALLERARAVNWIREKYPDCEANPTIAEAVFTRYLSTKRSDEQRDLLIQQLRHHVIWAGGSDALSQGLKFLLDSVNWVTDEKTRDSAMDLYRYAARYNYRGDEREFRRFLSEERDRWVQERTVTEASTNHNSGKHRLDHILYEIAYIDYLLESYSEARDLFIQSVDASLMIIERGIQAGPNASQWNDGARSLANVWVAAGLERAARARELLCGAFSSSHLSDEAQEELSRLAMESALIHRKLVAANSAPAEKSASLYIEALQTVRSEWCPPADKVLYPRTPEMERDLVRHERNVWCSAIKLSCWPTLFGFRSKRILTKVPPPGGDYHQSLSAAVPQIGLSISRDQQIDLLYHWADGGESDATQDKAISTAAFLQAAGTFQYLGDLLLLAWRCASSDEVAGVLSWYLENHVPDVGFNGIPKKALKRLSDLEQRMLVPE